MEYFMASKLLPQVQRDTCMRYIPALAKQMFTSFSWYYFYVLKVLQLSWKLLEFGRFLNF